MNTWAAVETQMPKDDWGGLICLEATDANTLYRRKQTVMQGYWGDGKWCGPDMGHEENKYWRVSHWMDFPEPPASCASGSPT